ncbi:AAA family ATPase [uncultured Megasphaera sp.]|uniref:AAA family ATPase n=1 Tax=uncultured Megasphaera sp. TaxID=165188 RepID=UPI0025D915B8|nr:AAA family ATPase [uncultured Megasphaera sp.]
MSRLIAIASGKGGVGKTLITASLSVLLQRRGYRVLAADADMGLRNLDLLFGMDEAVKFDASQAARGKCLPRQALVSIAPGLDVLPASQKRTWEKVDIPSFHYVLESLAGEYDFAFVDCPPGRDEAYRAATALADQILFVVEPSPSSLHDAQRVIQYCMKQKRFHYDVILNNFFADGVISPTDAMAYLNRKTVAGILPHDEGIDLAAGQGEIHKASDQLPFFQALAKTADWLEKRTAIDQAELIGLLPRRTAGADDTSGLSVRRRRQECRNWRHYRR